MRCPEGGSRARLIETAIDTAADAGLVVVPSCPFAHGCCEGIRRWSPGYDRLARTWPISLLRFQPDGGDLDESAAINAETTMFTSAVPILIIGVLPSTHT